MATDTTTDSTERLQEIERMTCEYMNEAEHRGQDVHAENYRNIRTALLNLLSDMERNPDEPSAECPECERWIVGSERCPHCNVETGAEQ